MSDYLSEREMARHCTITAKTGLVVLTEGVYIRDGGGWIRLDAAQAAWTCAAPDGNEASEARGRGDDDPPEPGGGRKYTPEGPILKPKV